MPASTLDMLTLAQKAKPLAALVAFALASLVAAPAGAYCFWCNCNQTYYDDLVQCTAECHVSLACFTGICTNSSQDKCSSKPGDDGRESAPGKGQTCGGDPVVLASGSTYERNLDAKVEGALAPLELFRTYMSRDAAWQPPAGSAEGSAPRPYGASPTS